MHNYHVVALGTVFRHKPTSDHVPFSSQIQPHPHIILHASRQHVKLRKDDIPEIYAS